jgi:hypothetical protein
VGDGEDVPIGVDGKALQNGNELGSNPQQNNEDEGSVAESPKITVDCTYRGQKLATIQPFELSIDTHLIADKMKQ